MKPKVLWSLALLGLVLFVIVQVLPMTSSESPDSGSSISKEQAVQTAADFAANTLGISNIPKENAAVTYTTQSDLYGYLSKENLLAEYNRKYAKQFPTERFRVQFKHPDSHLDALNIEINMKEGNVVGFDAGELWNIRVKDDLLKKDDGSSKIKDLEGSITADEKEELAAPYVKALGFNPDQLSLDTSSDIGLTYNVKGYTLGDTKGQLKFHFEYGEVSSLESRFSVPQAHTDYINSQTRLATWLTMAGYGLLTFILGILAIVYSARTRPYASFKRGIFLSLFYLFINVASTLNMMPAFEAEGLSGGALTFALVFQMITTLVMAASIYFSLVGGDGLWKVKGSNMWLRSRDPGYGSHVLQSAINGYAWALILLGIQSVIYIVLGLTIHTWSTTDETQSPYNMVYPWLFPLMAWMAGIGEEAVYRLFGIPMLKKIVRSTFVACLITTFIWALGHTLYPIYPVISRPIELTFIGLLFSYIFLRHGYIAAMFAHVIFDSILMGLSLILMGGALNITIGIVTFALPAVVGYVIQRFNPPGRERPASPRNDNYVEGLASITD
ncbi:CPBP family intramembrane glutamic endopeptidase [Paenibacillus caui]|uniref:CPBP family intramembrane glutamic endopeptidase n=1 Tax=Paenibacillus caui TaxID=2873927 RepID=UPI001F2AFA60|nr:CPBP family intramembrane glutamic endopeptidase [Paenibacillus caui]